MLVHKLVFFCWLVSTCFGETAVSTTAHPPTTTLTTATTESSTGTSTSPPTSTTQTTEKTVTTSKPSETTTKGDESSSTTSSTTVTESSTATSTSPPTSTTQTTEKTLTTSKPSETTTKGDESSSTTSSPTVTESSTATSTSPPTSTTQTPEDTSTTSKPSETTTTPGQESSSTTSSTTVTESSTATSTSPPTSTTQTPEDTSTTSKPSETTTTPGQESSSTTSSTTVTGSSTVTSTSLPTSTTTSNESTVTSSPTPSSTLSTSPATSQPTSNATSGTEATSKTTPGEPSTTTTTVPTTTKPPACSSNPCPFDSICVELFDGFTCQCFAGSFLSEGSCRKAKVFPGNLRLTDQQFQEGMKDTGSKIFLETAKNIQTALKVALGGDPNYIESIVLQLKNGSIIATVDNIYDTTSGMTPTSFDSAFNKSVQQCGSDCAILLKSTFTKVELCTQEPAPCDVGTTTCQNKNDGTLNCLCKTGYIRSTFSNRSCSACPSGQKVEKGICVPCSFGYSGFNCNDSNLLAVVVISCVLGGLLLITLLAFTIYGCRTKPKDYSSPYPPAQETRTTWTNSNVPKIPRASANVNAQWDSNLEMTESGSTRALVAKDRPGNGAVGPYSGMKTFASYDPSPYYGRDNPRFVGDYERGTR